MAYNSFAAGTGAPEPIPARCLVCPALNKILLLQEATEVAADFEDALRPLHLQVKTVLGIDNALARINELDYEFVVWDTHAPRVEEIEKLRQLRVACPKLPVLVLADSADANTTIELMKAGAHDCLAKPVAPGRLQHAMERALKARRSLCDAFLLPGTVEMREHVPRLVGRSLAMQEVYKSIGLVAERDEPVLICGESGTGKELVARAIHRHSGRGERPFVAINCAALPETLLESELFGHEKGAFTGASQRRLGAFERADGGTLFLDEIGDMSLPLQAKILRVLQQGEIHRVGGQETIHVGVRILAATNKVLEKAIQNGGFREDLYYRLNVISIRLPSLREHAEDIHELVDYFIDRYSLPGRPRPALDARAVGKLQTYPWPGNVRELENTIRRALVLAKGQALMEQHILLGESPPSPEACAVCRTHGLLKNIGPADAGDPPEVTLETALHYWLAHEVASPPIAQGQSVAERLQAKLLEAALDYTQGNQVRAARLLGISRTTLREWIKKNKGTPPRE